MSDIVKAALVQTRWTGDEESMIDASFRLAKEAASQGAQVLCFQELFYGPYFCQVQDPAYYAYAEPIPGPVTERVVQLACETGMVVVAPIYEEEQPGVYYNTAVVVDADGRYLGKYRKHHIPQVKGFLEKYYFRPGNLGFPVFDTAVGRIGVYICYDIQHRRLRHEVRRLLEDYDVRPPDPDLPLKSLSGGNQQKVVIAKAMAARPRVLLLDEPTNGVDVGARSEILEKLRDVARAGTAVVCATTDASQLEDLCDRVFVLRRGRLCAELTGDAINEDRIVQETYTSVA